MQLLTGRNDSEGRRGRSPVVHLTHGLRKAVSRISQPGVSCPIIEASSDSAANSLVDRPTGRS